MNIRTELKKFCKSFVYAACGIGRCIRTQRNMRFHMGAAGAVLGLSLLCHVSSGEALALILTIGGVMALECVNTAIESAVDLAAKGEISDHAKAAKDSAAGAVLVFCFAAVGLACAVFLPKLSMIIKSFSEFPALIAAAAIYAAVWFWWVFICFTKDDSQRS